MLLDNADQRTIIVVTMHIDDQTYTVNGKTYRRTLLRNSYRRDGRICHDTIANLSKCGDDEIKAMKFALANKKDLEALATVSGEKVRTRQGLTIGAVWLLHQLARRFGLVKALGNSEEAKRSLWLVIAAVIGSVSRLSATRLAQSHAACDIVGLDSFCEDDLYQALDWLHDHQVKIEDRLFKNRYHQKPDLYLYDVTSSYLEGNENELGEYGYDRDKKRGKKIIVIGLLTDAEGRPVSSEVFPGNTRDMKTFSSQVAKVAGRFGIDEVTFVGDRGMIKSAQIKDLSGEKFHYITALTKPEIATLLKKNVIQMELFDETVCEVLNDDVRYVFRCNPVRAREIREVRQSKLDCARRFCAEKNRYLAGHARATVKVSKREVGEKIAKLKIDKWVSVSRHGRVLSLKINDDELEKEEKLDGCYVVKTDLSNTAISKQAVHDRYKDLAEVEWAFRTMKTTLLHLRGIFVRKANRTRAHVFTIMLAYLVAYELRRLWRDIEVTIEEGIEELSSLCATEVMIGDVTVQTVPQPRETGAVLLQKAGVSLPDAIPCRGKNVFTRKKLVTERRTS